MQSFKNFIQESFVSKKSGILKEYLTKDQLSKNKKIEMSPEARKNTDDFFGVGNDRKIEDINNYQHDKSEIHQKVERHLGTNISHDEYKSGIVKDKYGRDSKIGKLIKDNSLRNEFASDSTRSGSKSIKKPYMSIVRGVHVMGQTNPEPDNIHPTGHSWKNQSCKNITNGSNRHYLQKEVLHGSVVVFGHDHDGKEIYRATLHPHLNDNGHVAYAVDGEYGIHHPDFVAHAQDVAVRLSGDHKGGSLMYKKHPSVYDDTGRNTIMHPNTTAEDIDKALKSRSVLVRQHAIQIPNATAEHISKALDDKDKRVRLQAILHSKINAEHISKALDDKEALVRATAVRVSNPKVNAEHISKAINDEDERVRADAIQHPKATIEHVNKAVNDKDSIVRQYAVNNPNATIEHISKALDDKDPFVRTAAILNPKATIEHVNKAVNDKDERVRLQAIQHPKATIEHVNKALDDDDAYVRKGAIQHPKVNAEHIGKALDDKDPLVRAAAIMNPNATAEHIGKALDDKDPIVRREAINHPKVNAEHISKALDDEDWRVRSAAVSNPNATIEHINKALFDEDPNVHVNALYHPKYKKAKAQSRKYTKSQQPQYTIHSA